MTLTRELRTGIALMLAIVLALTAFVLGTQRQVHAEEPFGLGEQVNCYIEQGAIGTFDTGRDYCQGVHPGESGDPSLAEQIICYTKWRIDQVDPNVPFEPELNDYCNMPPPPAPQCDDTIDNDGDGLVDYPLDPGCTDEDDDSESPNPPPLFQCMDSIDNDQDGLVDYPNDPGCSGVTDNDETNSGGNGGTTGADLAITKAISGTTPAPSSTVTYTITVTSNGPQPATNVSVSDLLPYGVLFVSDNSSGAYASATGLWTIGTMASGSVATLTITAEVLATSGVQVLNTATVQGSTTDPNTSNNSASVSFTSTVDTPGGGGSEECSDSQDNDGDGDIDYPADNDCESVDDNSEEEESRGGGGGGSRRSSGGSRANNDGEVLGAETGECPMYLTGYIKYGAANDAGEVAKLQVFLNQFEGATLNVSGTYDAPTLAAVNAFQRKYASDILTPWGMQGPSGYVYYTTQKQINTIYCEFVKDFPLSADQIEEIAYVREIQPTLRAQGTTSVAPQGGSSRGIVSGESTERTVPAVGSVVLPSSTTDQNATTTTNASTTATSTKGWFGRFTDWLFGR